MNFQDRTGRHWIIASAKTCEIRLRRELLRARLRATIPTHGTALIVPLQLSMRDFGVLKAASGAEKYFTPSTIPLHHFALCGQLCGNIVKLGSDISASGFDKSAGAALCKSASFEGSG